MWPVDAPETAVGSTVVAAVGIVWCGNATRAMSTSLAREPLAALPGPDAAFRRVRSQVGG